MPTAIATLWDGIPLCLRVTMYGMIMRSSRDYAGLPIPL